MKVEDFKLEVEKECRIQGLPKPETVEERLGSVKLRISLADDACIDLCFNEETKTITSAEKRIPLPEKLNRSVLEGLKNLETKKA